jgi:hypothetical protein
VTTHKPTRNATAVGLDIAKVSSGLCRECSQPYPRARERSAAREFPLSACRRIMLSGTTRMTANPRPNFVGCEKYTVTSFGGTKFAQARTDSTGRDNLRSEYVKDGNKGQLGI